MALSASLPMRPNPLIPTLVDIHVLLQASFGTRATWYFGLLITDLRSALRMYLCMIAKPRRRLLVLPLPTGLLHHLLVLVLGHFLLTPLTDRTHTPYLSQDHLLLGANGDCVLSYRGTPPPSSAGAESARSRRFLRALSSASRVSLGI